jgi:hypothetical protein
MDSLHPALDASVTPILMPLSELWALASTILEDSPSRRDFVLQYAASDANANRPIRIDEYVDRALVVFIERALRSSGTTLYAVQADRPVAVPPGVIGGKYPRDPVEPFDGFAARELFHAPVASYQTGVVSSLDIAEEHESLVGAGLLLPPVVAEQILADLVGVHGLTYGAWAIGDDRVQMLADEIEKAEYWDLDTALLWVQFESPVAAARLKMQWRSTRIQKLPGWASWPWLWISAWPRSSRRSPVFTLDTVEVSPTLVLLERLRSGAVTAYRRQGDEWVKISPADFYSIRAGISLPAAGGGKTMTFLQYSGFALPGQLRFDPMDFGVFRKTPEQQKAAPVKSATIEIKSDEDRHFWRPGFIDQWMKRRTNCILWSLAEVLLWIVHRDEQATAAAMFDWSNPDLPLELKYRTRAEQHVGNFYEMSAVTICMTIAQYLGPWERAKGSGRPGDWATTELLSALRTGGIFALGHCDGDLTADLRAIPGLDWDMPVFDFEVPPENDGAAVFRAHGKTWRQVLFDRVSVMDFFGRRSQSDETPDNGSNISPEEIKSLLVELRGDDGAKLSRDKACREILTRYPALKRDDVRDLDREVHPDSKPGPKGPRPKG